ncbi:hypothetical protein BaRGS_00020950, partial [Batillaria attramentaria]
ECTVDQSGILAAQSSLPGITENMQQLEHAVPDLAHVACPTYRHVACPRDPHTHVFVSQSHVRGFRYVCLQNKEQCGLRKEVTIPWTSLKAGTFCRVARAVLHCCMACDTPDLPCGREGRSVVVRLPNDNDVILIRIILYYTAKRCLHFFSAPVSITEKLSRSS